MSFRHAYTTHLSKGYYGPMEVTKIYACSDCNQLTSKPESHACKREIPMPPPITIRPLTTSYTLVDTFATHHLWRCNKCSKTVSSLGRGNIIPPHKCKPHWTTPPYKASEDPCADAPEEEELREAALVFSESELDDSQAEARLYEAATAYAATQASYNEGKNR